MARRVLVIDTDASFHDLLTRCLTPYGVEVHVVNDGSDGLAQAAQLQPELIYIAVDLPATVGFALCNKAKKGVAKNIPVILATQTLPPAEMEKHRNLKVHADEYIDKRTISIEDLIHKMDALMQLGPPVEEVALDDIPVEAEEIALDDDAIALEEEPPEPSGTFEINEATNVSQHAAALIDPNIDAETDAVFAGLVDGPGEETFDITEASMKSHGSGRAPLPPAPPPSSPGTTAPQQPPPVAHDNGEDLGLDAVADEIASGAHNVDRAALARISELEGEVQKLRTQLDEAKKGAGLSSPFSREREFLNLREVINRKEKEILDLREEVDSKDRLILGGKDKIRELDRKVRDADEKVLSFEGQLVTAHENIAALKDDKDKALEREKGLKARIDIAQGQLRKADEEFESLKKKTAAEVTAARDELSAKRQDHEREKRESVQLLDSLKTSHATNLKQAQEERVAAIDALTKQLGEERDAALAELGEQHTEETDKLKQDHLTALTSLRGDHARQIEALEQAHEEALEAAGADKRKALEDAAGDKAAALAAEDDRRKRELAAADEKRIADLEMAEGRRVKDLAHAADEKKRALEDLEVVHAAAVSGIKDDHARAFADAEDKHTGEIGALTKAHDDHRAELHAAHEQTKTEAEKTRSDLERQKSDVERQRTDLEEKVARLEQSLSGSRERARQLEAELSRTAATVKDRDEKIGKMEQDVSERDTRIAVQKGELDTLEKDNADLQEQLLKALQKLKADEAVVNKAKKAMAIALTLLDGEAKAGGGGETAAG